MKIAVVGSGISGLSATWLCQKAGHDVQLFERNEVFGGHARTRGVTFGDKTISVDTGFIVFNKRNYPNLVPFFEMLDVPYHASDMSFAAMIGNGLFEYSCKSLTGMFPTLCSLADGRRWKIARDYFRFGKAAKKLLKRDTQVSLGTFVHGIGVSEDFIHYFILPIGGAIWSCPVLTMMDYPAQTFCQFFENHGLLDINGQPQWHTVTGGSRTYVEKVIDTIGKERCHTSTIVVRVAREDEQVHLTFKNNESATFDHVIMAGHANTSLALIDQPTDDERRVLSAFRFQPNEMVLHGDLSFMPVNKKCWASWVYQSDGERDQQPQLAVTYWMNLLQSLPEERPLLVSLNPLSQPDEAMVYDRHSFSHPIFDKVAIDAQTKIPEINGTDRISYVGAWQRFGFHEDGIWSAVRAMKQLGVAIPWE